MVLPNAELTSAASHIHVASGTQMAWTQELAIGDTSHCSARYDVSGDGEKFLVMEASSSSSSDEQMHVVTNWDAALRRWGQGLRDRSRRYPSDQAIVPMGLIFTRR
jgi:hypothetical protein